MATDNALMSIRAEAMVREFVPKFRTVPKAESRLHKLIAKVLFFIDTYMKEFWTTIGYTAAFPPDDGDAWWTVLHEGRHGQQSRKMTRLLMGWWYLFPLSLGLMSLVAATLTWILVGLAWWQGLLWLLASLGCCAPLPAYGRMRLELDAYTVTLAIMYWWRKRDVVQKVAPQFYGWNYYKMWPFNADILARLYDNLSRIEEGSILSDPYFNAVFHLMRDNGFLHGDFEDGYAEVAHP